MASLLMAIFAWFASLFAAAEAPRHTTKAQPTATVAKAPAARVTPALHVSPAFVPAETSVPPQFCDTIVQIQDGPATMTEALSELQTIRISSAAGRCDRTFIIRNAKLRTPALPIVPQPLSALSRNS